ncbi:MAG: DUF2059 domain-containing protein [Bacteroidota bacterium]
MKKLGLITALLFASVFALRAQDDAYGAKVKKMMELSGAMESFEISVKNIVQLQRESYEDVLSEAFFTELERKFLDSGLEKLIPKLIPIYREHLTEEDLDAVIAFHESEVGVKLRQKNPLILNGAMTVGAEWGRDIAMEVFDAIENSSELLFTKELDLDCSEFKKGFFKAKIDGSDTVFQIERKGNEQMEKINGEKVTSTIEWISSHKFILSGGMLNEQKIPTTEVSIYEVDGNSCKFVSKQNGVYIKGSMQKVGKRT